MYHDVYSHDTKESGLASDLYKVDTISFEKQIQKLAEIRDNQTTDFNILLTFDDGGSSFYPLISNILEKYNFKGYFFIATNHLGTEGFLRKEDVLSLHKQGHHIGSHSHTHPENISNFRYEEIVEEWRVSLNILEQIVGEPVNIASVPNGYTSDIVIRAAKEAGIELLYTSEPTTSIKKKHNVNLIGRYVILSDTSNDYVEKICTSMILRFQKKLKAMLLSIPKIILGDRYEIVKNKILGQN